MSDKPNCGPWKFQETHVALINLIFSPPKVSVANQGHITVSCLSQGPQKMPKHGKYHFYLVIHTIWNSGGKVTFISWQHFHYQNFFKVYLVDWKLTKWDFLMIFKNLCEALEIPSKVWLEHLRRETMHLCFFSLASFVCYCQDQLLDKILKLLFCIMFSSRNPFQEFCNLFCALTISRIHNR